MPTHKMGNSSITIKKSINHHGKDLQMIHKSLSLMLKSTKSKCC